ncbi:MAG: hypothetical protein DME26_00810 [Verrucomicrobia bacterium]|nr:MAG: hypothetical protein DME26_00810 [Verrucomicrobiota bacterium]
MADENAHPLESRIPLPDDLVKVCREMNARGAKYMVVGGFAVIQHGYLRNTGDIDLLIDDSLENQTRIKRALEVLPDKAVRELGDDDLRNYVVVRVCDEVVVDLMTMACGINYQEAEPETQIFTIDGVPIPFASAKLLLRTKQTHRDKDAEDRLFLEQKIAREGK